MKSYIYGEMVDFKENLTSNDMYNILNKAHQLKHDIEKIDINDILNILDKLSKLWSDKNYNYRKEAIEKMPSLVGFSKEMIEKGIETLCSLLNKNNLETRIKCDIGDKALMNDWSYDNRFKGFIMANPLGVVAHISAGNVFVGGVDSLIQGILTKNINIMKMSSVDPLFPVLFAKSLKDNDYTGILHKNMALLHWKGGTESVENVIKNECNAIVVYGGEKTVRSYRKNLGLHTKIIEYGPKYSFVAVQKSELEKRGMKKCAKLIALDALMWEQSACSSPHLVYIEGNEDYAKMLAKNIADSFEGLEEEIPQGKVYDDEAVEITKVRELAKVEKAFGNNDYFISKKGLATVVYQKSKEFQISCHNRTLFVKAVDNLESIIDIIKPMGDFIQTVAILSDEKTAKKISKELSSIGADRFVEIGKMAVRKHGTPHDGTKGLQELVKWVSLSRNTLEANWNIDGLWNQYDENNDYFDFMDKEERDKITFQRIKNIVNYAKEKSPILAERYKNIEIESLDDFYKLPLMTGDDYKKYLPPYGKGLVTDDLTNGYIFSSGGTTGTPKVVYRTTKEQHFNAVRLGKGLKLSVFQKGDRVANLLFAGNMWASFVSFNQALEHTGCQILPIGGNLDMKDIIANMINFKANAIITIPSVLLSVAEFVEKENIQLTIEKVATGGEHLFKEAKEYLKKVLGVKQFASTGYTTNDTGAIGYQCKFLQGGVHHIHEDLHFVEILNEKDEPCKVGEIGKIVVTNLQRKLMPTIRYEVGDSGRWVEGSCKCGRKTKLIELLGRCDDVLIIGGGNIHPEVVAEAIYEIEGLSSHFQMIAEIYKRKDRLRVVVEKLDKDLKNIKEKEDKLKQILYNKSKELDTMYKQGLIEDIKVEITEQNSISRNPRTGKIKLIKDKRS